MSIKENASRTETWIRGLFIVVFAIIFYILCGVIALLVVIQFITKVITGKLIDDLSDFSPKLTDYAMQILTFITFQTDTKPWPFTSTPEIEDAPATADSEESGAIEEKKDQAD